VKVLLYMAVLLAITLLILLVAKPVRLTVNKSIFVSAENVDVNIYAEVDYND